MKRFRSMSPHDFSILGSVAISTGEEVSEKVKAARTASPAWRALGIVGRSEILRRVVQNLNSRAEEFATLATKEMGMPITQSREDVQDALRYFSWYLDNAEKYLAPEVTYENSEETHTVYREPRGVVGVIVPWNYPASNFVWGCGQNLIAGNTVVFKHSEEVPLCGQLIEKILKESGVPEGVFNEIYGKGPVGALLARQNIDLICFTGSTLAGESLYRTAGAGMKKIVMELGGSAPGIVFEDADFDVAVESIYRSRFSNAGQSCDALKRLLVHENVWDRMLQMLKGRLDTMVRLGDPMVESTTMGPLASKQQLNTLELQVADAVGKGAFVLTGGKQPGLAGVYYEPTLLINITPTMRVWQEEVFGPVLPIIKFKTEEEAIALANDTEYGLGAYVYTKDKVKAERVTAFLQTGMVSINGASYVRPMNPFGGYKHSGLGRLHGRWGFEEVTEAKVVARRK
ncbi:MAG: aldehyde dehydrogenase family protein [Candidatus Paceibacterota bacterium]